MSHHSLKREFDAMSDETRPVAWPLHYDEASGSASSASSTPLDNEACYQRGSGSPLRPSKRTRGYQPDQADRGLAELHAEHWGPSGGTIEGSSYQQLILFDLTPLAKYKIHSGHIKPTTVPSIHIRSFHQMAGSGRVRQKKTSPASQQCR